VLPEQVQPVRQTGPLSEPLGQVLPEQEPALLVQEQGEQDQQTDRPGLVPQVREQAQPVQRVPVRQTDQREQAQPVRERVLQEQPGPQEPERRALVPQTDRQERVLAQAPERLELPGRLEPPVPAQRTGLPVLVQQVPASQERVLPERVPQTDRPALELAARVPEQV
jgi:hypothetical protein